MPDCVFDKERMDLALASETFMAPTGMTREETRQFIITCGESMPTIHEDGLVKIRRNSDSPNTYKVYDKEGNKLSTVRFQDGLPSMTGINGLTNEAIIAIVMDRLKCQNKGDFKCAHNDKAIECLGAAKAALEARVSDREKRGVSGTHSK